MEGTGDRQNGWIIKQDTTIFPKKEASTASRKGSTEAASWANPQGQQPHPCGPGVPEHPHPCPGAHPVPRCPRGGVSAAPAPGTHLRPAGSAQPPPGRARGPPQVLPEPLPGKGGRRGRCPWGRGSGTAPTAARKARGDGRDVGEAAPRPPCPRPALAVRRRGGPGAGRAGWEGSPLWGCSLVFGVCVLSSLVKRGMNHRIAASLRLGKSSEAIGCDKWRNTAMSTRAWHWVTRPVFP